jgi:choline dehydrogenase-like flavoprotein
MSAAQNTSFDVVIVGAGVSAAMIAKQLGMAGKRVLILESGAALAPNNNDFMNRFYMALAKVPEIPYTPDLFNPPGSFNLANPTLLNAARPSVLTLNGEKNGFGYWKDPNQSYLIQDGPLAFGSTYERVAGGTMRHWLGTSLRFVPNDFKMQSVYHQLVDWPISYDDVEKWYGAAEAEIGVSANAANQGYLGIKFPPGYKYPMNPIPSSLVDDAVSKAVAGTNFKGTPLVVTGTPAGRNSQPYQSRRVCAGNTNCIPICPIQAKYDPSVTLEQALNTGNVTIWPQTVATEVIVDTNGRVSQINYVQYQQPGGPQTGSGSVTAKVFVIAAHAIETPKLLLMSKNQGRTPNGVANHSLQVGKNLMDHPLYLAWALAPQPIFGYRGPLATSGIESTRDGSFRNQRAAFRIEIGNEGWNFPINDPYTTTTDFINGLNQSGLNPIGGGTPQALFGPALTQALNNAFTKQFRFGFLVEQSPDQTNTVTLASQKDNLGLPRPKITYGFSQYTLAGLGAAVEAADQIFAQMKAQQFTVPPEDNDPSKIEVPVNGKMKTVKFFGSGHIVGTYRMGPTKDDSVVNFEQRSWDHPNLFLVGSGVFPTVATGNPTLTIAALSLWAAQTIKKDLG